MAVLEVLSIRQRIAQFKQALTVAQLADILGVSQETIYKETRKGIIPSMRIGGSIRFCPEAVSEWLAKTEMTK